MQHEIANNEANAMRCKTLDDPRRCAKGFRCNKRIGFCMNANGQLARARTASHTGTRRRPSAAAVAKRPSAAVVARRPSAVAAVARRPSAAAVARQHLYDTDVNEYGTRRCYRNGRRCPRGTRCVKNLCLSQETRAAQKFHKRANQPAAVAQYFADQADRAAGLAQVQANDISEEKEQQEYLRKKHNQELLNQELLNQEHLRRHNAEEERLLSREREKEKNARIQKIAQDKELRERQARDAPIRQLELANELIKNLKEKLLLNNFEAVLNKNNTISVYNKENLNAPEIVSINFPTDVNEKTLSVTNDVSNQKKEKIDIILESLKAVGDYYNYTKILFNNVVINEFKNIRLIDAFKNEFQTATKVVAWRSFDEQIKIAMYDINDRTVVQNPMYYQLLKNLEDHGWDEKNDLTGGIRQKVTFQNQCFEIRVKRTDGDNIGELTDTILILMLKCCPQPLCTLSASDILRKLVVVSNRLKQNLIIDSDESYDFLGEKTVTVKKKPEIIRNQIMLPYYCIFLYGYSFYQRLGFNNERNKLQFDAYNHTIRNIPITNILKDYKKYYIEKEYVFAKSLLTLKNTYNTMNEKKIEKEIEERMNRVLKGKTAIDLKQILNDYIVKADIPYEPTPHKKQKIKTGMVKLNEIAGSKLSLHSTINDVGKEIVRIRKLNPPLNKIYKNYVFDIYDNIISQFSKNNFSHLYIFKYDPKKLMYKTDNIS